MGNLSQVGFLYYLQPVSVNAHGQDIGAGHRLVAIDKLVAPMQKRRVPCDAHASCVCAERRSRGR